MRPLTGAFLIAGSFLLVSVLYVTTSDEVARQLTRTVSEYHRVQSVKGIGFMVVASLGIFGLSFALLRRIKRQEVDKQAHRERLFLMERRVLAGTLAASIVHDVKNLVGVIQANLLYIKDLPALPEEMGEPVEDSLLASEQLLALHKRLKSAAKKTMDEERTEVDLVELVEQAVSLIDTHAAVHGCKMQIEAPVELRARVFPNLVTHAVINLVLNAATAAADGERRVRVRLGRADDVARIVVEDSGPGIPVDQREAVLEAYTSQTEGGTGLGLFSVSYCASSHDGRVVIDDSELGGALIRLELPIVDE